MISINEALEIVKNNLPEPAFQECDIKLAADKYLAQDIYASEPSPRFTNSAMDGFAVRWQDVCMAAEGPPASLKIVGESQAGIPFASALQTGQSVRISTGAMVPEGADTVIRIDDTEENGDRVTVLTVREKGQDIRYRGEEFNKGDLLLPGRTKITAPQLGLLVSVGIQKIKAYRSCKIAILVTGSELVSAGESIEEYQIRDSNMAMLQAAVEETGGELISLARIADDRQATVHAMKNVTADIILCAGGVSVGRHDHVKDAAEENGFEELFWRISQKPGKPLYLAKKGKALLFGLPGNPVSAFMCFIHYVRPVITSLNGQPFGWPTVSAKLASDIENKGKRTNMIRVQLNWRPQGGYCLVGAKKQGSHMLTSLANADGYIILGPGRILRAGERCDVYRYEFRREPV